MTIKEKFSFIAVPVGVEIAARSLHAQDTLRP